MIACTCPECGESVEVPECFCGTVEECPLCGKPVAWPNAAKPQSAEPGPNRSGASGKGRSMNTVQRWSVIGGLVVCAAAVSYPPVTLVQVVHEDVSESGGDNLYTADGRTCLFWPDLREAKAGTAFRYFRSHWHQVELGDTIGYRRIDWYRAAGECGVILALTGAAFLVARRWDA